MKLITLHLPEPYIRALDELVNEKYYPNRAEAIRTAVRDLLSVEAWGRRNRQPYPANMPQPVIEKIKSRRRSRG